MSLHALVEKWRSRADELDAKTEALRLDGQFIKARKLEANACYLKACADELEAAIAGAGEPVAWMDHMGGVITAAMKNRDPGLPYNIPLTHPAGAVQVTDEMVETVGSALYIYWNDVNKQAKDAYRAKVRAALTAALNPGGSRE